MKMKSFNTTFTISERGGILKGLMKCKKCRYKWIPRKSKPKSCPKCKARLDI